MKKILAIVLSSLFIILPTFSVFGISLETQNPNRGIDIVQKGISINPPSFTSETTNKFLNEVNNKISLIFNTKNDDMKALREENNENFSLFMDYNIKFYGDIVSLIVNNGISFGNTFSEDVSTLVFNIKEEKFYTLKDFLGKDAYKIATDEVKRQMMENKDEFFIEEFKGVNSETGFYINTDGEVIIIFNKYEVAPGVAGTPQFVIPIKK